MLMAMFLIVGCQTTQSAETETKPEVVKEVNVLPKQKEVTTPKQELTENPFQSVDIPANQVVTSTKPVMCGRIDTVLSRMESSFGEKPIMVGKAPSINGKQVMVTLTYNEKTGSYTFLEQMPMENRLICIISSGNSELTLKMLGSSY